MEQRIEAHAKTLVAHCVDIESGDMVVIEAPPVARDLVVALYEQIGTRGGVPVWKPQDRKTKRAFLRSVDMDEIETPVHEEAFFEKADVAINVTGSENADELSDVPAEKMTALEQAREPIYAAATDGRWVQTQYPTPADAQRAEMSTEAYRDFVWSATNKDWGRQANYQSRMVEILEDADQLMVSSGERTQLTMSLDGMHAVSDVGESNLPGGEVFTAPVVDSVEGTLAVDEPMFHYGREIVDAVLQFADGTVVEHSARRNESTLTELLDTDDGARRLGEFGVGMNDDIDRFTRNILFDEKMAETVHFALGRAYEGCVGERRQCNGSTIHVDMLVDVSENARIEVDGEVVQRNGTFRFEDGFDAASGDE